MLDGGHAEGAEERDLVASADGVDFGVGAAGSTRLAAEVVLKDLLALGGHVAASVLADVLPSLADDLAVDLELVEGVVGAHSDGQSKDGSGGLHLERVLRCLIDWFERGLKRLVEWNYFFDQRRRVRMNECVNE